MRNFKYPAFWAGFSIFWVLLIIWGTLTSHVPQGAPENSDKVLHFAAYGFIGGWFGSMLLKSLHLRVALVLIAFGCGMEVAQHYTGVRHMDILDALANTTGVILGISLARTALGEMMGWFDARLPHGGR